MLTLGNGSMYFLTASSDTCRVAVGIMLTLGQRVLFVGSHNGGIAVPDMFMMIYEWFHRFGDRHPIYGLMHPAVWKVSPPWLTLLSR